MVGFEGLAKFKSLDRRHAAYEIFESDAFRVLDSLAWRIKKLCVEVQELEQAQAEANALESGGRPRLPEFNYDKDMKKLLKKLERKFVRYCKSLPKSPCSRPRRAETDGRVCQSICSSKSTPFSRMTSQARSASLNLRGGSPAVSTVLWCRTKIWIPTTIEDSERSSANSTPLFMNGRHPTYKPRW